MLNLNQVDLSQSLQTKTKQFKRDVTFLSGYNGFFSVTNSNIKFYFKQTITNENDFFQITIPPGAYEIESLNYEIKRIMIDQEHCTEAEYPFQTRPNFSTLGSIIEKSSQGPIINFVFDDSIRNLMGFNEIIL